MKKILLLFLFTTTYIHAGPVNWWKEYKGVQAFKNKQYEEASTYFNELLDNDPYNPIYNYNIGETLYKQKKHKDAQDAFLRVVNSTDQQKALHQQALFNAGNCAINLENFEDAIERYKQLLQINFENKEAAHNLKIAEKLLEDKKQNEKNSEQDDKSQQKNDKDCDDCDNKKKSSDGGKSDSSKEKNQSDDNTEDEDSEKDENSEQTKNDQQDVDQQQDKGSSDKESQKNQQSEQKDQEEKERDTRDQEDKDLGKSNEDQKREQSGDKQGDKSEEEESYQKPEGESDDSEEKPNAEEGSDEDDNHEKTSQNSGDEQLENSLNDQKLQDTLSDLSKKHFDDDRLSDRDAQNMKYFEEREANFQKQLIKNKVTAFMPRENGQKNW